MDSPLGSKVTAIYERYTSDFKQSAKDQIAKGDDLFNFPTLKFTPRRDDSERIDHFEAPKMIIAGSGMSNGGRIVQHEEFFLPDPNTTLLLPGYQAVGTLGRQIEEGAKEVVINSRPVKIRAEITSIFGYSSHKDSEHLVEFVADTAKTVKKVFVTMGEPKSGLFLVQRLRDYVGVNATFPRKGESVELEF
jgi:metallo-beta-lactamase family protein